jgi:hypothetical protein
MKATRAKLLRLADGYEMADGQQRGKHFVA